MIKKAFFFFLTFIRTLMTPYIPKQKKSAIYHLLKLLSLFYMISPNTDENNNLVQNLVTSD